MPFTPSISVASSSVASSVSTTAAASSNIDHTTFMRYALQQAQQALGRDETPIGAILTHGSRIIARAYIMTEAL